MANTIAELKTRRAAAERERGSFQPLLDEAYQYAIPFRRSSRDTGTGEKRVNQVFDHTAIDSAFRFAGKLQQDLWPAGQQNFSLEPGPVVLQPRDREQLALQLEPITKKLQAFFDDGDFDMAFHEMAIDLSAGTGLMLLNPTDEPDKLWDPISVSIDEVLLEGGANGRITGIFWNRKMTGHVLKDTWPEGKLSLELEELIKARPDSEFEVKCDTVHDRRAGRWHMHVWLEKQADAFFFSSESRTCPWLTPRYYRVSGESYGRGLVMLAMPTIKTLNTAKRLQLQAAAIAMLGIYTAVDDGVFNPDLSPVEPGQFWKVARNAGAAFGPSVQRFEDPRLDLQQLVLQDLATGVKATMMDDDLPLTSEAVKTPTEILERVRRGAANQMGAFGRLVREIVVPTVKRAIEIAYNRGLIAQEVPLDQLLVRVKVKSPLAMAREAQRIQKIMEWLQIVIGVESAKAAAPSVNRIAHTDLMLTDAGRDLGVDAQYIVTADQRADIDKQNAQAAAAQAAMAMTGGGG